MGFFDKNDDKPISPIRFLNENETYKESPISFFDKEINGKDRFAILKTTDNGKYIRGNMLYYSFNGVEVYTELNNIIFVDVINNSLFIRENKNISNEIAPDNPETKQYIILYTDIGYEDGDDSFPLRWESSQGRKATYENIKINAPIIDIDKSIVLVENVALKDCLTVRQFVNYIKNSDMIENDDFDINEFAGSEYI